MRTASPRALPGTWHRARGAISALLVAVVASGCLPQPATRQGDEIAGLWSVFLVGGAVVFAIVWALLTVALLRFRTRATARPATDEPLPAQTHGHILLEVVWTALPALTIAVLFVLTMVVLGRISEGASEPEGREGDPSVAGGSALEVHVEAFQWGWRMSYPELGISLSGYGVPGPEAVLPVRQPVRVTLEAVDVIHAFYVPEFLVKYDAVPGREHTFPLLIEREGVYGGQCAEFCGLLHAAMPFTIRAVAPERFAAWVEEMGTAS